MEMLILLPRSLPLADHASLLRVGNAGLLLEMNLIFFSNALHVLIVEQLFLQDNIFSHALRTYCCYRLVATEI